MKGRLVPCDELSRSDRDRLYGLFRCYFDGVTEKSFLLDLEHKNWVILLEDEDAGLAGFSTLRFDRTRHEGRSLSVVYSGDTIVGPGARSSPILSRTWIESVRSLYRRFGEGRLVWLLITSGFRTYRFLPVFWRRFFPRHDEETPRATLRLMNRLASQRFGAGFDPQTGTVRFEHPQVLARELRGIPASRMKNPHVAFFARANPGHEAGDELVCLADLADANLTAAGRRMVGIGRSRDVTRAATP